MRLKVGLRMLMVMRDGGVAFQAEQRWRSGQKRLEDGGVKGQRAWEMGEWQIKPWASDSMRLASGSANKGVGGA